MPKVLPLTSILFLLTLVTLQNTAAKPVHKSEETLGKKYAVAPIIKSNVDAFKYLTNYGYNPCENETGLKKNNKTSIHCQADSKSMIKNFQRKYKLKATGKLDKKTLKLMNTPRCGIKDHPLAFKVRNAWPKKSFTWKLATKDLPSFGEENTREQLRESFNDWVRYAPITFKEASANEEADFDLAFTSSTNDPYFNGTDTMLGYAFLPTDGTIRFNAAKSWTQKYDHNGFNFRILATHEIGHGLGLDHSDDELSIMTPYYSLRQPEDLLSDDDLSGIQVLYGTKTSSEDAMVQHGLPHGTVGGGSFDDALNLKLSPTTPCVGVQLFWKPDYLFAIRFIYQQDHSSIRKVYYGGFGDPNKYVSSLLNETFMMNDGERINKVTGYVGTSTWVSHNGTLFPYVLGIQFYTTAGRTSRLYGSNKGEVFTESYEGFTLGYAKGSRVYLPNIAVNARWTQNGVTVAGGNNHGDRLNQLSSPHGLYVDGDQTIYVTEWSNHRVVEWKSGRASGQVVAGGNGAGNRTDQLIYPTDVVVDKMNDSLIICDFGNRRVVQWSRRNVTNAQTVISDIDCSRLAIDNNGELYISDYKKNEVRRWKLGEKNGTIVAGGNGKGNLLSQLNDPSEMFVDEDYSLYVSDCKNHRVMKWMKGAQEGIVVAGGQGQGNSLTQLSDPNGVIVDDLDRVYVADTNNRRIMRWSPGSKEGHIVVGENGQQQQPNQLSGLRGLSFDREGNIYIVERNNHQVQKFNIDPTSNT